MRKTIFDSLMISDSERIHTQTLAWILSLENEFFPNKSDFIKKLFDLNHCELNSIDLYVETELNRIDLFIQTTDKQFLIENKLKSSEHNNQTKRYIDSIPERLIDTNKTKHFGFLTLINDEPQNQEWKPISFEKLRDSLKSIQWPDNKNETIFILEYIQTLDNLVNVFNQFVSNHKDFENVFTDGYKKKYEKHPYTNESKDYIRKNQLETIFQKAFLKIIAKEAEIRYDEIGETRGTALIQIYFREIIILEETFRLGFQFQGKTLKINLAHKNYADSKPEQMGELLMNTFKNRFFNKNGYENFNKPRSKAYISVSKNISNEIYKMEKSDLIKLLKDEIDNINNKSQEFEKEINTAYNTRYSQ
jgi:hypothetical protein